MQKIFKNQYKRQDIFSCNHSSHFRFGGKVSTYYILEEKKCYPEGCINFIWRCRLLHKGHACPKKFSHVGRKCFSCKQFYEEKYHQAPKLKVSEDEYRQYLREKEDFDYWLDTKIGRQVEMEGEVVSVKPNILANGNKRNTHFRHNGWILIFKSIFINYDVFDDTAFAWISNKSQHRFGFRQGDQIEAIAGFNFENGRLTLNKVHNIEIKERGIEDPPDISYLMVAIETGSVIPIQPEKCMLCPEGVLTEKNPERYNDNCPKRALICLRGKKNPIDCIYHLREKLSTSKE